MDEEEGVLGSLDPLVDPPDCLYANLDCNDNGHVLHRLTTEAQNAMNQAGEASSLGNHGGLLPSPTRCSSRTSTLSDNTDNNCPLAPGLPFPAGVGLPQGGGPQGGGPQGGGPQGGGPHHTGLLYSPEDTLNNDFFYDEEFTVQFDATLEPGAESLLDSVDLATILSQVDPAQHEDPWPPVAPLYGGGRMTASKSDSCLYQADVDVTDSDPNMSCSEREVFSSSDMSDLKGGEPLFSPPPPTSAQVSSSEGGDLDGSLGREGLERYAYDWSANKDRYMISFDRSPTKSSSDGSYHELAAGSGGGGRGGGLTSWAHRTAATSGCSSASSWGSGSSGHRKDHASPLSPHATASEAPSLTSGSTSGDHGETGSGSGSGQSGYGGTCSNGNHGYSSSSDSSTLTTWKALRQQRKRWAKVPDGMTTWQRLREARSQAKMDGSWGPRSRSMPDLKGRQGPASPAAPPAEESPPPLETYSGQQTAVQEAVRLRPKAPLVRPDAEHSEGEEGCAGGGGAYNKRHSTSLVELYRRMKSQDYLDELQGRASQGNEAMASPNSAQLLLDAWSMSGTASHPSVLAPLLTSPPALPGSPGGLAGGPAAEAGAGAGAVAVRGLASWETHRNLPSAGADNSDLPLLSLINEGSATKWREFLRLQRLVDTSVQAGSVLGGSGSQAWPSAWGGQGRYGRGWGAPGCQTHVAVQFPPLLTDQAIQTSLEYRPDFRNMRSQGLQTSIDGGGVLSEKILFSRDSGVSVSARQGERRPLWDVNTSSTVVELSSQGKDRMTRSLFFANCALPDISFLGKPMSSSTTQARCPAQCPARCPAPARPSQDEPPPPPVLDYPRAPGPRVEPDPATSHKSRMAGGYRPKKPPRQHHMSPAGSRDSSPALSTGSRTRSRSSDDSSNSFCSSSSSGIDPGSSESLNQHHRAASSPHDRDAFRKPAGGRPDSDVCQTMVSGSHDSSPTKVGLYDTVASHRGLAAPAIPRHGPAQRPPCGHCARDGSGGVGGCWECQGRAGAGAVAGAVAGAGVVLRRVPSSPVVGGRKPLKSCLAKKRGDRSLVALKHRSWSDPSDGTVLKHSQDGQIRYQLVTTDRECTRRHSGGGGTWEGHLDEPGEAGEVDQGVAATDPGPPPRDIPASTPAGGVAPRKAPGVSRRLPWIDGTPLVPCCRSPQGVPGDASGGVCPVGTPPPVSPEQIPVPQCTCGTTHAVLHSSSDSGEGATGTGDPGCCTSATYCGAGGDIYRSKKSVSFCEEVSYHSPRSSPRHSPKKQCHGADPGPDGGEGAGDAGVVRRHPLPKHLMTKRRPLSLPPDFYLMATAAVEIVEEEGGPLESPPQDFTVSPGSSPTPTPSPTPPPGPFLTHSDTMVDITMKKELVLGVLKGSEVVLSYFSQTRSLSEKVRLGSTTHSTEIGDLVLDHLCVTVGAVVRDGLNPYVRSLFGKVKNSVWKVVEDSAQAGGPSGRVFTELVRDLKALGYLTTPALKFNAFLFGLLNHKALDFWLGQLQTQRDVLGRHYSPTSFLQLSATSCRHLFLDVTTALQPLAQVPFRLEYRRVAPPQGAGRGGGGGGGATRSLDAHIQGQRVLTHRDNVTGSLNDYQLPGQPPRDREGAETGVAWQPPGVSPLASPQQQQDGRGERERPLKAQLQTLYDKMDVGGLKKQTQEMMASTGRLVERLALGRGRRLQWTDVMAITAGYSAVPRVRAGAVPQLTGINDHPLSPGAASPPAGCASPATAASLPGSESVSSHGSGHESTASSDCPLNFQMSGEEDMSGSDPPGTGPLPPPPPRHQSLPGPPPLPPHRAPVPVPIVRNNEFVSGAGEDSDSDSSPTEGLLGRVSRQFLGAAEGQQRAYKRGKTDYAFDGSRGVRAERGEGDQREDRGEGEEGEEGAFSRGRLAGCRRHDDGKAARQAEGSRRTVFDASGVPTCVSTQDSAIPFHIPGSGGGRSPTDRASPLSQSVPEREGAPPEALALTAAAAPPRPAPRPQPRPTQLGSRLKKRWSGFGPSLIKVMDRLLLDGSTSPTRGPTGGPTKATSMPQIANPRSPGTPITPCATPSPTSTPTQSPTQTPTRTPTQTPTQTLPSRDGVTLNTATRRRHLQRAMSGPPVAVTSVTSRVTEAGAGGGPRDPEDTKLEASPAQDTAAVQEQFVPRFVQTLCHYVAMDDDQLSFDKGTVLAVVKDASSDWLRCRRGLTEGLVHRDCVKDA